MQRNLYGYGKPALRGAFGPDEGLDSSVFLPDTRACVRDTRKPPFRFICCLTDGRGIGTGVLIGPRTVLTAGHALDNRGLCLSQLRAVPARNDSAKPAEPFGMSGVAGVQLPQDYKSGTATDYGVAILRDPVGSVSGWWTPTPSKSPNDPKGTSIVAPVGTSFLEQGPHYVEISGYAGDCPAKGRCPSIGADPCNVKGVLPGTVQYHTANETADVVGSAVLNYFLDMSAGMSGSPVWIDRPAEQGGRTLLAVNIGLNRTNPKSLVNCGVLIQGLVWHFVRCHSFWLPGTTPPTRPTVKFGANGPTVLELQYRLNIWILTTPTSGQTRLEVDSKFGPKTLSAVRAFQKAMGLTVDGIVGPQTWRRLQLPY